MKHIFLNLKRFDIGIERGGVNSLAPAPEWGPFIARTIRSGLSRRAERLSDYSFAAFFPEAHLLGAAQALADAEPGAPALELGCQGVHYEDTAPGGNFGAFTGQRTANAARGLGCGWALVGHSEERRAKLALMEAAGASREASTAALDAFLNRELRCALAAGLKVLFCVGETADERPEAERVLRRQVERGLADLVPLSVVLAYEPVWAIGPGKTPPSAEEIARTASLLRTISPCPLVYGGGLKKENAEAVGAIRELDGGLIALTRFSGAIGFYPDEYAEIVELYAKGASL